MPQADPLFVSRNKIKGRINYCYRSHGTFGTCWFDLIVAPLRFWWLKIQRGRWEGEEEMAREVKEETTDEYRSAIIKSYSFQWWGKVCTGSGNVLKHCHVVFGAYMKNQGTTIVLLWEDTFISVKLMQAQISYIVSEMHILSVEGLKFSVFL